MTLTPEPDSAKKFVRVALALILREGSSEVDPRLPSASPDRVNSPVEVLITRRLDDSVYGGWWEFPGGKIEPGEDVEHAAIREAREELGVAFHPHGTLRAFHHVYEHASVELHPVLGQLTAGSDQPQNIAVSEHRWVPAAGLVEEARFLPGNRELVRDVAALAARNELLIPPR
ncbi:MAG: NUDIX domain-containing protein [Planctomycetota bacterium]